MRYVRYADVDGPRWALLDDQDRLTPLARAPWEGAAPAGPPRPRAGTPLLAPAVPGKIVCVGRNYREHARELANEVPAEPLIFLKPSTAVIGPETPIEVPAGIGEVHHEAELALVIGRRLRGRLTPAEARDGIFALTALNDVTARTIQRAENKFTRAKGFDTFCPMGPWLVDGLDPEADRAVFCRVDGVTRQSGRTGEMVFPAAELVRFVAAVMTLEPGDVIATGTPAGVGPIEPGETVEVEVEGVGVLRSPVVARPW